MRGSKGYSKYDGKFFRGQKFDRLTIIDPTIVLKSYGTENRHEAKVLTKCECGNEKLTSAFGLLDGRFKGCGCQMNQSGKNHPLWTGGKIISGTELRKMKSNADCRNLTFSLSVSYLEKLLKSQNYKCQLSGLDLNEKCRSLDRIDSSLGYTDNNVRWIHKDINIMKNSYSEKYFIYLCNIISKMNPSKEIVDRERICRKNLSERAVVYEIMSDGNKVYKLLGPCGHSFIEKINRKKKFNRWNGISWKALTTGKETKKWKLIKKSKVTKDLLIQAGYQLERCQEILLNNS
jgi:hypothetical protein